MNCKNCQTILKETTNFCDFCGAKVILKKITFKNLLIDFFITNFAIDSRFFLTLKKMALKPDEVLNDYLDGVRKRYVNPFAFLAVGAGLSLIIFNYFADDFVKIQDSFQIEQLNSLKEKASIDITNRKDLSKTEIKKLTTDKKIAKIQLNLRKVMWDFMLRYLNLLTFIFLLINGVLSKWTFWKPHNFGEHLVINAYTYGFSLYITLIMFFAAMYIHPSIYMASILISIIYYMYVFGKFYKLSLGKNILKLLQFLIGLFIVTLILGILSALIGFIGAYLDWFTI